MTQLLKTWIIVSLLLVVGASSSSFAEPADFVDPSFVPQFEKAARAEFKRRLKALKRPLKFYHYGTRGNQNFSAFTNFRGTLKYANQEAIHYLPGSANAMMPSPLKPTAAVKYFKGLAATHASRDGQQVWSVGAGVYFAMDPVQSEKYIGLPWFLLEMELPAGIRYLDIQGDNKLVLPEPILEVYRKIDRDADGRIPGSKSVVGNGVIFGRLMRDDDTREVLIKLFQEFQVDFIAYTWDPPSYGFCTNGAVHTSGVAISAINPSLIDRAKDWNLYVANLEANAPAAKKNAYRSLIEKIEIGRHESKPILSLESDIEFDWSDAHPWVARVATYGWNEPLGRVSLLDSMMGPKTLKRLGRYVNVEASDDEGGPLRFARSSETIQALRAIPAQQRTYTAELFLKRFKPNTAAALEARIRAETWGCGADGVREEGKPVR